MPTYARGLVEYEVDPERGVYRYREPLLPEEASRALLELLEYYVETGRGLRAEEAWAAARRLGLEDVYERYRAAIDYYLHRSIEGLGPLEPLAVDLEVEAVSIRPGGTWARWRGRWLRVEPPVDYGGAARLVEGAGRRYGRVALLAWGLRGVDRGWEVYLWRAPRPRGPPEHAALAALLLEEGHPVTVWGSPGSGAAGLAVLILWLLRGRRIVVDDPYLLVYAPHATPLAPGEDPYMLHPEVLAVNNRPERAREAVGHGVPVLLHSYKRPSPPLPGLGLGVSGGGSIAVEYNGAPAQPESIAGAHGLDPARLEELKARALDVAEMERWW